MASIDIAAGKVIVPLVDRTFSHSGIATMIAGWFFLRGMTGAGKELKGGMKIASSMIACAMVIGATLAHGDKYENIIVFGIGLFPIADIAWCEHKGMTR